MPTTSQPAHRHARCYKLLLLLLIMALPLCGCGDKHFRSGRKAAKAPAKPAPAATAKAKVTGVSLASLYGRLPDGRQQPQSLDPSSITPQSELSLEVGRNQGKRLKAEFQRSSLQYGSPIFIRIFKESRELELWVQRGERYYLFKKYPIAYFSGGLGPKNREGDEQAPEGFYEVVPDAMNPWSNYHLAFNIGYPNEYDTERGATGGQIMVHGKKLSVGCFAMTDPVIEEIYAIADRALNAGQSAFPVHIFPFRMTPGNLQRHADSPHMPFWRNLLHGYTLFELSHVPPKAGVSGGKYALTSGRTGSGRHPLAPTKVVSIRRDLQVLP